MTDRDRTDLAAEFETHRPRLRAVAGRVLGSPADADDAVQEAWVRLARTDADAIADLPAWLTTVVARVSLSMLRARRSRPEASPGDEPVDTVDTGPGPSEEVEVADAVGTALLVVLDSLGPAERLAFVLHDLFGMPFDEIAPIVERTPAAARQLASRARRRVRGGSAGTEDPARRRRVVEAFLAAARDGDFAGLLAVLDPDVVLRADDTAVAMAAANRDRGAPDVAAEMHGADAVARVFCGRAAAARPVLVDGEPGAAYAPGGRPFSVFRMTFAGDRIVGVEMVVDPDAIAALEVVLDGR